MRKFENLSSILRSFWSIKMQTAYCWHRRRNNCCGFVRYLSLKNYLYFFLFVFLLIFVDQCVLVCVCAVYVYLRLILKSIKKAFLLDFFSSWNNHNLILKILKFFISFYFASMSALRLKIEKQGFKHFTTYTSILFFFNFRLK